MYDCPRCGEFLRMREPSARWMRFFECVGCWLAFHLVREVHSRKQTVTMQQGRVRR